MIIGLAPMDGVTDLAYRTIVQDVVKQYNTADTLRTWTEFMNTDGYMTHPSRLVKHLIHQDQEKKLIAQIYGWNPDTLIKTAIDIEQKYPSFFGIELNIGCPSPKVMSCGWWSGMMRDKQATLNIIKNISTSITKPFSIKVRAWLDDNDKASQQEFILAAAQYCKTISIHGRTFKQGHSGDVDRDMMYRIKKEVGNTCNIIGNGGIKSYADAQTHLQNLDGIMIAQAAIGDPRVLTPHIPTPQDRYDILHKHLALTVAYESYFLDTLEKYPENPEDTILMQNKKNLHSIKIEQDDDTILHDIPEIQIHNRSMPFPSREELQTRIENIDTIVRSRPQRRSVLEFRKYAFNYLATLPGSKECKIQLAQTKDYFETKEIINTLFSKLS